MRRIHEAAGRSRSARAGFTLVEMMAVLLILSILIGILVVGFTGARDAADVRLARQSLANLALAIEEYSSRQGDYPASSTAALLSNAQNPLNEGAEGLVLALHAQGQGSGTTEFDDLLINSDGDSSATRLSNLPRNDLYEIADHWGNPIAYFHRVDYGKVHVYTLEDPGTGERRESQARALKNPKLGTWYRANKFQLVSAGPDGLFGTEDDVANFEFEVAEGP